MDGGGQQVCVWRRVLRPPVLLALLAPVLLLADLAVVTFLTLKENWEGVILSLGVLLVGMQATYWYFRAREICTAPSHQRLGGANTDDAEALPDNPPSYEEAIKSEAPPPPYYMVVPETYVPSTSINPSHTKGQTLKTSAASTNGIMDMSGVTRATEGITSPLLHQITNSEEFCTLPTPPSLSQGSYTSVLTSPLYQGPVDVMREPILREVSRVLAPTHLPSPTTHTPPGFP